LVVEGEVQDVEVRLPVQAARLEDVCSIDERKALGVAVAVVLAAGEPVAVEISLAGVHAQRETDQKC
jgi:hypothetical protein